MTDDSDTLQRARSLTQEYFPNVDFQPRNVIAVTWYKVLHNFLSSTQMVSHTITRIAPFIGLFSLQMNTFQVALVYDNETSFAFFFYEEANVQAGSVAIGFNSRSPGASFTIPRSGIDNIEENSNTGVAGLYAYRVDTSIVLQPERKLIFIVHSIY